MLVNTIQVREQAEELNAATSNSKLRTPGKPTFLIIKMMMMTMKLNISEILTCFHTNIAATTFTTVPYYI